ncbi:MAG: hypothetical protein AAFQ65_09265 [Myxococcota bacterium]
MSLKDLPIVFLHGITGSYLEQVYTGFDFSVTYSGLKKLYKDLDPLELNDDALADESIVSEVERSEVESIAYGELLGRLRRLEQGRAPVYAFRYDWRYSNVRNAEILQDYLEYLEAKASAKQFRFICHSMGNLVLSAWLQGDLENRLPKVRRAALCCPPFGGSPSALEMLVVGEASWFSLNRSRQFRKIGRTFPALYELLPTDNCLLGHPNPNGTHWSFASWPAPDKTHDSDAFKRKKALIKRRLDEARMVQESQFVDFDSIPKNELKNIAVFCGTGRETLTRVEVREKKGKFKPFFVFDRDDAQSPEESWQPGDQTVPLASATRFKSLRTIEIDREAVDRRVLDRNLMNFHAGFMKIDKVISLTGKWLSGRPVSKSWAP